MTRRQHFVTFVSPGTFIPETSTKPIKSWDPKKAVEMSGEIKERYGAKPYSFHFTTRIVADPIPDGEGGTLEVEGKDVAKSPNHFLGGTVLTFDEVKARNDPKESMLVSNMECNGFWTVIKNTNSFKAVLPFRDDDVVVDADGKIIARADDPKYVAYRKKQDALKEQRQRGE
jgi:hypothetical protein